MSDYRIDADVDFNEANERVRAEIRRTVNALGFRLQRTIQEDMLTGQRLKAPSGRLRGSVSFEVNETNDSIEATVGAGGKFVSYAFIHEFGLKGSLAIKAHLRMIKKAFGKPITPRQVLVQAHSRNVDFRERRFMRDSLDEMAKIVPKNIDAAIQRGLSSE